MNEMLLGLLCLLIVAGIIQQAIVFRQQEVIRDLRKNAAQWKASCEFLQREIRKMDDV